MRGHALSDFAKLDQVRELALALPDVVEATSYGTPAFKVKKKLFARMHQDRESLVLRVQPFDRELLLTTHPKIFYLTPHYEDYPWVLLRLGAANRKDIARALKDAWLACSPNEHK